MTRVVTKATPAWLSRLTVATDGSGVKAAACVDDYIGVVAVGNAGQRRQLGAHIQPGASDEHLIPAGAGDRLMHSAVLPGVDKRAINDRLTGHGIGQLLELRAVGATR